MAAPTTPAEPLELPPAARDPAAETQDEDEGEEVVTPVETEVPDAETEDTITPVNTEVPGEGAEPPGDA